MQDVWDEVGSDDVFTCSGWSLVCRRSDGTGWFHGDPGDIRRCVHLMMGWPGYNLKNVKQIESVENVSSSKEMDSVIQLFICERLQHWWYTVHVHIFLDIFRFLMKHNMIIRDQNCQCKFWLLSSLFVSSPMLECFVTCQSSCLPHN